MLRSGWLERRLPIGAPVSGPFFHWADGAPTAPPGVDGSLWLADADRIRDGELRAFSSRWVRCGWPPNWHRSVLTGATLDAAGSHWTRVDEFGLAGGDIKGYWEPARFDGLLMLALGWLCGGEENREAIETWVADWSQKNPAHAGVQWRCAQETSLRLMAVLLTTLLLERRGDVRPTEAVDALVAQHCERILPTLLYAVGQDNNHGTSEAAALFAAGTFLLGRGGGFRTLGRRCAATGRARLEERVARLVMRDGSFSQHSTNYHRMALDTVSFAETWRRLHGSAAFSDRFYERCRAATAWLDGMTDPDTGDAPNLGANDGARLFVLHRCSYRDHRPSVQWASVLFRERPAYPTGAWDESLRWLALPAEGHASPGEHAGRSTLMPDGGYARLNVDGAWALLRLPVYRFRPSHSDALHLDLWVASTNLLRDGGSFSYNTDPDRLAYYGGVRSHNTIQLDGRDQMPRLSRFLFGRWLEPEELDFDEGGARCVSAYRDYWGAWHRRAVRLEPGRCSIEDEVRDFERSAVLRWRLAPGAWDLQGSTATMGSYRLRVTSDTAPSRLELVTGHESRHYGEETPIPVLEVEVAGATSFRTEVTWLP